MPRPLRITEPGGFYHVRSRGNDGRAIFIDDVDRRRHLALLSRAATRHRWLVFGYCQMTNHFHLALQLRDDELSAGMQELLTGYAREWNRRHGHTGHLFRSRFESSPILSERHLVATVRYVDLNPVRAGMKARPELWPWSSYRSHAGLEHAPQFLALGAFHALLGPTPVQARRVYKRFVRDGLVPVSDTVSRAADPVRL
jgi:REP element-mobilizing transposase RayT